MMNKMFMTERRDSIMTALKDKKRITVKELSTELKVSEATLRADLNELEKLGKLERTHGGAILLEDLPPVSEVETSFTYRQAQNTVEKTLLAQEASKFLSDGDCILLDASSTALELAKILNNMSLRLTVVTSGIYTALELRDHDSITVILLGGVLRKNSSSLEGVLGISILDQINVDYFFTSANGFSLHAGLTDFNVYEVELKKKMVEKVHKVVALIDATKIGKTSISTFAEIRNISSIITNKDITGELKTVLEREKVDIINVK
ncbi:DeoR/GlpR family DNA-binding transcription regulator [Shouchella sp. JSM 1781072]|uniref:DeoR/GlpR family DNA-binding transcription regulator n=1 Tax=Bacillaceae TaxID=186817 RepID=UPI00278C51FB|nr:DeoR/GlpR family DNA-binding transcription regulator [Bacillus sp. Marseille-P3800]